MFIFIFCHLSNSDSDKMPSEFDIFIIKKTIEYPNNYKS